MDAFKEENYEMLKAAMENFALALKYDELFSEEHQGIRRALHTIYDRLKTLNTHKLVRAFEAVQEAEKRYRLSDGTSYEHCRLWREMEHAFGPYSVFKRLANESL
jgi:Fe2+ or Zn2+ uptake regulation protein